MSSCLTVIYFLRVLYFTNSGIMRFSEKFVKFLTCDFSFQVYLRNEFHFSGVHGAMNRSGSRAK